MLKDAEPSGSTYCTPNRRNVTFLQKYCATLPMYEQPAPMYVLTRS